MESTNLISFGKHKNRSILQLFTEDPKYIIWLAKQQWVSPQIIEEISSRLNSLVIPFGRHEGKTLETILEEDKAYYDWVVKDFVKL